MTPKQFVLVSINGASTNVEVIPYEIGITGHENNRKPNKSCDKVTDENANYANHLDFKIKEK